MGTKRVHKGGLQSLLTQQVRGTDNLSVRNFVKAMKQSRKSIFHDDDAPPTGRESKIHAVCLQLFAAGMISFKINDERMLGTEKVCAGDLSVICPNVEVKVGVVRCVSLAIKLTNVGKALTCVKIPN